jgi:type II secretory pathway pseudopilin PulG
MFEWGNEMEKLINILKRYWLGLVGIVVVLSAITIGFIVVRSMMHIQQEQQSCIQDLQKSLAQALKEAQSSNEETKAAAAQKIADLQKQLAVAQNDKKIIEKPSQTPAQAQEITKHKNESGNSDTVCDSNAPHCFESQSYDDAYDNDQVDDFAQALNEMLSQQGRGNDNNVDALPTASVGKKEGNGDTSMRKQQPTIGRAALGDSTSTDSTVPAGQVKQKPEVSSEKLDQVLEDFENKYMQRIADESLDKCIQGISEGAQKAIKNNL